MTKGSLRCCVSAIMLLILIVSSIELYVSAQVPLVVDGHIYMPDGTPAAGASVTVTVSGGPSNSTTSGSDGYYRVDLVVSPGTRTVTVRASKDSYSGSATGSGEAHIGVDVRLSAAPPPPPPPPPPKESVNIQLNVPSGAAVNTSVKISGKVAPRVSPVYLKVKDPKQGTKDYELSVGSDGSFFFDLIPLLLGTYKISAYFQGDATHESASTSEYPLQVKTGSILNLTISPTVVVAGAENVSISGSLYPPSAQNVSLYYSLDNVSWIFFAGLNASTGVFSMIWEPRVFGDVFIKAEWGGNETYFRSAAYGRFVTVLPSTFVLEMWVTNTSLPMGAETWILGVLRGVQQPENAELTLHVYRGGEEVETIGLRASPDGGFSLNYKPGSPGFYVFLLEASGRGIFGASKVATMIVLGEITLKAVNSAGELLDEAVIELKHSAEATRSESGELTAILDLGNYEVIVKKGDVEVFKGFLNLTRSGVLLSSSSQSAEFPLPVTGKPLVIELRTETYSLSVNVVNEFGEPLGNVEVKASSSVFQAVGRTGANGLIVFSNIPAGTYAVSTSAESKNVNLVQNEFIMLKGPGINPKLIIIIEVIALVALCFATVYFARKKPVTKK